MFQFVGDEVTSRWPQHFSRRALQASWETAHSWRNRKIRLLLPKARRAGVSRSAMLHSQMKHVIDRSELLGVVRLAGEPRELCVTGGADYDEAAGRLVVRLAAFLRPVGSIAVEERFRVPWLPADQTVTEAVAREDCHELALEIFKHWEGKVRSAGV
jgi:hypothetical protein